MVGVHFVGDGDVRVSFSGPVNAADWIADWLQLEDTGLWGMAETVAQETATSLLFNGPDFPNALGTPWRLVGHPVTLAAPYSGVLT